MSEGTLYIVFLIKRRDKAKDKRPSGLISEEEASAQGATILLQGLDAKRSDSIQPGYLEPDGHCPLPSCYSSTNYRLRVCCKRKKGHSFQVPLVFLLHK